VFLFSDKQSGVDVYPHEEAKTYSLAIRVHCWHLYSQVSSAAQISNALSQKFSAVKHLTLEDREHSRSSEEHNEIDRIARWRQLLRPFANVKTLLIPDGLIREFSRCLQSDDGEFPLELLPELQELIFSGSGAVDGAFTQFIDARKNVGRPVTLTRR
jgi:hypothetical protein